MHTNLLLQSTGIYTNLVERNNKSESININKKK